MVIPFNGYGSGVQSTVSKKGRFEQTKMPKNKESQLMAGFEASIYSPHPPRSSKYNKVTVT